jgi:hypothetical protein
MTTPEMNDASEFFSKHYPELWTQYYPKVYPDITGTYWSPKTIAAALLRLGIADWRKHKGQYHPTDQGPVLHYVLERLRSYRMPFYYVAPALLDAVLRSELPEDIVWDQIQLPLPCATFILPEDGFSHPLHGSIRFISYAATEPGQETHSPYGPRIRNLPHKAIHLIACAGADGPEFNSICIQSGVPVKRDGITKYLNGLRESGFQLDSEEAWDFSGRYPNLLFRILLAMQARPELISRSQFTGKRNKRNREIWTPNIIGKDYQIKRSGPAAEGSGGWNVRMHWRRGHLRIQPHGPNNSLRKTIWIEPMLIGAEVQEHANVAAC